MYSNTYKSEETGSAAVLPCVSFYGLTAGILAKRWVGFPAFF